MEVHQHAQHGGKKSWKSYFWEFLMLFLAVFCGFSFWTISPKSHIIEEIRKVWRELCRLLSFRTNFSLYKYRL